jgi:23S rRNA pseudouridine955/2504/2580 synthase
MPENNILIVTPAEAGQKLLRFLERKLKTPRPSLYRWLRTGQVRLNKGRAGADHLLEAGDEIRLPPQAQQELVRCGDNSAVDLHIEQRDLLPGLKIIHQDAFLLALDKPAGLPAQPGSKHIDSVSVRLKNSAQASAFIPAPAHRLDRQSTGLMVAGKTHLYQSYLHSLFAAEKPLLEREYLLWVKGIVELLPETEFVDYLAAQTNSGGMERMGVVSAAGTKASRAAAFYSTIKILCESPCGQATLLKARLLTGRKHQIRAQCAGRGHALIGDGRYGGPFFGKMLLHSFRLHLPGCADFRGQSFPEYNLQSLPVWPTPFDVAGLAV